MRLNLSLNKLFDVVPSDLDRLSVEFAMQSRLFRGIEFALRRLQAHGESDTALPIGIGRHCADEFAGFDSFDRRFDPVNADYGNLAREDLEPAKPRARRCPYRRWRPIRP